MDADQAVAVSGGSCRKSHFDRENASFFTNVKDYFQEFINTPMEDHKHCFQVKWQMMVDKFSYGTAFGKKGGGEPSG